MLGSNNNLAPALLFTTLETGPDDSPVNLAFANPAGIGATTLHLMWDNNATNEDGIHIYSIEKYG